jgi:hypothetical protein
MVNAVLVLLVDIEERGWACIPARLKIQLSRVEPPSAPNTAALAFVSLLILIAWDSASCFVIKSHSLAYITHQGVVLVRHATRLL